MSYWIKLYHEILDDPKIATLPDRLWRRTIELFLIAGRNGETGELPDVKQMAWILRLKEEELEADLEEIAKTGIIAYDEEEGYWYVVNFVKRQAPLSNTDRSRRYRESQRKAQYGETLSKSKRNGTATQMQRECNENVADAQRDCNGDATQLQQNVLQIKKIRLTEAEEIDTEAEAEAERSTRNASATAAASATSPPAFSPVETAMAITAMQEYPEALFAEEVYIGVTKMPAMPPSIRAPATEIILALRSKYPTKEALIAYLTPYFERWKKQRGKNGKHYSPLSVGWLEWAMAGDSRQEVQDLSIYSRQWR
jgi:hypothetical protein